MYTLTLADIERARRMDIADAQFTVSICLYEAHRIGQRARKEWLESADRTRQRIIEARRDIVALRHAR